MLTGHSVGGITAQTHAYTFGDIDNLMVLSYSDTDHCLGATTALPVTTAKCQTGDIRQHGNTGPTEYLWFAADTAVVNAVAEMRSEDRAGHPVLQERCCC